MKKETITGASLQRTLLVGFLLLVIPVLGFGLMFNNMSANIMRTQISQSYSNALRLSAAQFHDQLKSVDSYTTMLLLDDDLNALSISDKGIDRLFDMEQFNNRMRLFTRDQLLHTNVTLIWPDCAWVLSSQYGVERYTEYKDFAEYMDSYLPQLGWTIRRSLRNPDEDCFALTRGYAHANQNSPIFIIEIRRPDLLSQLSVLSADLKASAHFIIDTKGSWYLSDSYAVQTGSNSDAPATDMAQLDSAYEQYSSGEIDPDNLPIVDTPNGRHYVLFHEIAEYGGAIGVLLDENELFGAIYHIRWLLSIAFIICALAGLAYWLIAYRKIVKPMRLLFTAMGGVSDGDFSVRVQPHGNDDISHMTQQFNSMVEQIDRLIREQYERKLELRRTQLRFLRSQIKPHFLYNCLFTLYTMIKNEETDNAADLAIYLGQYYQINTHSEEREVMLYNELDHVRLYLRIQSMRFGDRLVVNESVDDELRLIRLPNLALLTLVENSVTHGMKQPGVITLEITACKRAGDYVVSVSDDGIGMTDAEISELQARLSGSAGINDEVHGLQNINRRLQIDYDGAARIELERNERGGVTARLIIPEEAQNKYV